jgi:ketosteroid isomerase-like protein
MRPAAISRQQLNGNIMESTLTSFTDTLQRGFLQGDEAAATKATEANNVRVLQAMYRLIAQGNFDNLVDHFDEDIDMEIIGPKEVPIVGRWRGRQQVADAVRRNFGMLEAQQPEMHNVVAQGDTVVVAARERGRYIPTGRYYDVHFVQIMTFCSGKLVRMRQVFDSAPMLEIVQ